MKFDNKNLLLTAVVLFGTTIAAPAFAHRFNVALVIPLVGNEAEMGKQYREGFMLATTERDGHPDEESDGHLGGLDVYVSVIDANGDISSQITRIVSEGEIAIVATMAPEGSAALDVMKPLLEAGNIALLQRGKTPFSQDGGSTVSAFSSAFESQYGAKPTATTAQGYNAARRIDLAIREQGAADDRAALRENFTASAGGFPW
ncbi:MAG: hypothetical protein L3J32_00105 [Rhizobiaceae bacterium]|nr:hypothetical protein [Rhizobiaceae bacterium]